MDYYKEYLRQRERYKRDHSPEAFRDFPCFEEWYRDLRDDAQEWE